MSFGKTPTEYRIFNFLLYVDYARLLVQAKTCKFVAGAVNVQNIWSRFLEILPKTHKIKEKI